MKEYLNNRLYTALVLLILAGAVVIGAVVSHYNQRDLEMVLRANLEEQRGYLYRLAVITDSNGADEAISRIVVDCPRRTEFESLLVALATLPKKDLVTLQTLFESCGSFYAERKALMVEKLERELESYMDLIALLKILTTNTVDIYEETVWSEIVSLEKERSMLLIDQLELQEKIISALISGATVSGKEVSTLVGEAQNVSNLLTVAGQRVDVLREAVVR